jgi:hypothetical protein
MPRSSYPGGKPFREWCAYKGISVSMGYKLRSQGEGPDIDYYGIKPIVTGEADAAYEARGRAKAKRNRKTEDAA